MKSLHWKDSHTKSGNSEDFFSESKDQEKVEEVVQKQKKSGNGSRIILMGFGHL